MKVTAVVITRDRPSQVQQLVASILHSKMPPITFVLVDDSTRRNFEDTEKFLLSSKIIHEHRSSLQMRKEVERVLKRMDLTATQKTSIEACVGSKSSFLEFADSLSKINLFRSSFLDILSRSFSPYSSARNLGIYCACSAFDPERIVFLDDDCYIERPEKLMAALQLIGERLDGKEIIAVSGLYEDLALSKRKSRHRYEELAPTSILTGMSSFLKRSFLTDQQQRLTLMPHHTLGGALVLSRKVFMSLPFDPFIPRGEDHAYCVDLKQRCGRGFTIVRDNQFVVQHGSQPKVSPNRQETNTLRDIFRFVYLQFKVGEHFIPYLTIRWATSAIIHMLLEAPKSRRRFIELWTLLFLARSFAKRNAGKYSETVKAWRSFLGEVVR